MNPIDDPDSFPEYFPKPVYIYSYIPQRWTTYDPKYHSLIIPRYITESVTVTTSDTVDPSIWTWFKGLWR